jgi:uncharacterized pyridoxamine 5'-phosphate oxidase family protein
MKLADLPRKKRRQVEAVIKTMNAKERKAWDKMISQDEELLFACLQVQHDNGNIFDLDGIETHFKLARLLYEAK